MQNVRVSGFKLVPPFAQGLVRDLRVRWALEEIGKPYEVDFIDFTERFGAAYMKRHPFGMVPVMDVDGIVLFESGAILFEIGSRDERLLPTDPVARTNTLSWMFAALSNVEPALQTLSAIDNQQREEPWAPLRRPGAVEAVRLRLGQLSDWLAQAQTEFLTDRFTVADILMTTVLRFVRHTDLVEQYPVVNDYKTRCEARPAFDRALSAQLREYGQHTSVAA